MRHRNHAAAGAVLAALCVLAVPASGNPMTEDRAAGPEAPVPEVDRIFGRSVEALGGLAAVARCTTRIMTGLIVTDLERDEPVHEVGTFVVCSRAPDSYVIVQRTRRGATIEGSDGEVFWKAEPGKVSFGAGPGSPRDAWLTDPWFAIRLRERFPGARPGGARSLDGRRVRAVEVDEDASHALFFDDETGLLVRIGYHRELQDFREVDGILVPFRVVSSRKGGATVFLVRDVVHNVPIDGRVFSGPGDNPI